MDIVGYCDIKKDAKTCTGTKFPEKFIGKGMLRVFEFGADECVLVLAPDGSCLASFDACDVYRKFKCKVLGEFVLPPDLHLAEEIVYLTKLSTRKGGYNSIVRNMVIAASLLKGKYTDDFLFQIEREERANKSYASNG